MIVGTRKYWGTVDGGMPRTWRLNTLVLGMLWSEAADGANVQLRGIRSVNVRKVSA